MNLGAEKAQVTFDPKLGSIELLNQAVEKAGLLIPPILNIYRKYLRGSLGRLAGRSLLYLAMALPGLLISLAFQALSEQAGRSANGVGRMAGSQRSLSPTRHASGAAARNAR